MTNALIYWGFPFKLTNGLGWDEETWRGYYAERVGPPKEHVVVVLHRGGGNCVVAIADSVIEVSDTIPMLGIDRPKVGWWVRLRTFCGIMGIQWASPIYQLSIVPYDRP